MNKCPDFPVATNFTVHYRSLAVICSQLDADLPVASHCGLPVATHFTILYQSLAVICSQLDVDLPVASHCAVYCQCPTVICPHPAAVLPAATHCTIYYQKHSQSFAHTPGADLLTVIGSEYRPDPTLGWGLTPNNKGTRFLCLVLANRSPRKLKARGHSK